MLATVVLLLLQVPFAVEFVRLVVEPLQTALFPPIVPTKGKAYTVTATEAESLQPLPLVTIYLIVAVPPETPVTKPTLLTVAIVGFALDQTPPEVAFDKVLVTPTQIGRLLVI